MQVTRELMPALQGIQEVENGYEFSVPKEATLISRIAEFISMERLCCPFLEFKLTVDSSAAPMSLVISGPGGTQEFLQAEFEGAFT